MELMHSVGPIFLAVTVSVLVYIIAVAMIPKQILQGSNKYTRHMLDKLHEQNMLAHGQGATITRGTDDPSDNPLVRAFLLIPGMQGAVPMIQKAGLWRNLDQFVLAFLLIFLFFVLLCSRFGVTGIPLAVALTFMLAWFYLRRRINKRRRAFMDQFPDALDSIVRSVRAGHPLQGAISVVAENMPAPISTEFRRVADETAYGLTLFEALNRMAERLDEADVRFFGVVLAVQQEAGGNLSEVLSNLSEVLRKRRMLRLKIKALSSEGRSTAMILGALPFFVFGIIFFAAPDHLRPLWETRSGHILVLSILGMEAMGMLVVRQIVNMDV